MLKFSRVIYMKLILASKSPRRIEILKRCGYDFDIIPSNYEEVIDDSLSIEENVLNLAYHKGESVFKDHRDAVVLASDTVVCFNNIIIGKPKNDDDAFKTLRMLSGQTHYVKTGVVLLKKDEIYKTIVTSEVTFKELTDQDILDYLATNEHQDKAGSYAIQGIGKRLVKSFKGDFDNIVGLPINNFKDKLNMLLNK